MQKSKRRHAKSAQVGPMPTHRNWPTWATLSRNPSLTAAALIGLIILVSASIYFSTATVLPRIDHTDMKQVDLGRRLYASSCASCHGASLEGQPNWQRRLATGRLPAPPHDSSGHTWHHPDSVLFGITKLGPAAYPEGHQTDMPAFGKSLSDAEIAAVLAYIKSNWPVEIQRRQSSLNEKR